MFDYVQSVATRPPLANRGVEQFEVEVFEAENAVFPNFGQTFEEAVDFLTFTCPTHPTADHLLATTVPDEEGNARTGFASSERRECIGGKCWRRFDPRQPSNAYGSAYESWEWDGCAATWAARSLRDAVGYPSRVDVQWTFECASDYMADDLAEAVREFHEARGFIEGVGGEGGINTRYVGSKTSDRRIRIYRKDLQSAEYEFIFGPCMRVELILKAEQAKAWWSVWRDSEEKAVAAAALHIAQMIGITVRNAVADVLPPLCMPPAVEVGQGYFTWLQQTADRAAAFAQGGLPVMDDVMRYANRANKSASAVKRHRDRVAEVRAAGPTEIGRAVSAMMKRSA